MRLEPKAVLVGAALLGGVALLFALGRLFTVEADEARTAIDGRRHALEEHATSLLTQRLRERALAERPRQDAAKKDPLLDDDGLWLQVGVERLVPLGGAAAGAPIAPRLLERAEVVRQGLPTPASEPEQERRLRISEVKDATGPAREALVRQVLGHQRAFRLPAEVEATLVLRLLEALGGDASPTLARMLLRDGVPSADGHGPLLLEGAMRRVLRSREAIGSEALARVCGALALAANRFEVRSDDFDRRCRERTSLPSVGAEVPAGSWVWVEPFEGSEPRAPRPDWVPPRPPTSPWVDSVWWLESDGTEVRGARLELSSEVQAIASQIRAQGLTPDDAVLRVTPPAAHVLSAPGTLAVRLDSPAWAKAHDAVASRQAVKLSLLVAAGGLLALSAGLWWLAERRRLRFIELKAGFVAGVSHELRTPLASVRLLAETLERRLEGDPKAKDYPRRIVHEAERLGALVENVLSFNRLERGRALPPKKRVAVAPLLERVVAEAQAYPHARVEAEVVGAGEVLVSADAPLLELLVRNLALNACAYNARDPVQIRFEVTRGEGVVRLAVEDNGVGIAPEDGERVFDEFQRLEGKPGRGGPGTGLGLALCRSIARAHGGTLRLERSSPEGSRFVLELPDGEPE